MSRRHGPRWAVGMVTVVACLGLIAAPGLARPTDTQVRAAGVRDASRLLARASLPRGSVRLAAEPAGGGRLLAHPGQPGPPLSIDRHGWWRTPGSLKAAAAYVLHHGPRGAVSSGTAELIGPGIPPNRTVAFALAPRRGYSLSRTVSYELVALAGGSVGIRVDAAVAWLRQRAASEVVPPGVGAIRLTSAPPGGPELVSETITSRPMIRRIVRAFDALPIVQPGVYACPALPAAAPVVTLVFRSASSGRMLARAAGTDYGYPGGNCNPLTFTIGRRPQTPLLAGGFYHALERWLGVRWR